MNSSTRSVAFCVLGESRERGAPAAEPLRFRPILDLCASARPRIDRLELLVAPERAPVALALRRQLGHVAPRTEVRVQEVPGVGGPSLADIRAALADFAARYAFLPASEEYLLHLSSGSALQQVAWIWLWGTRAWPGRLAFAPRNERNEVSGIALIDHPGEPATGSSAAGGPVAGGGSGEGEDPPGAPPAEREAAAGAAQGAAQGEAMSGATPWRWLGGDDAAFVRSHPGIVWLHAPRGSDADACIEEIEAIYRESAPEPGARVDVACAALPDAQALHRALASGADHAPLVAPPATSQRAAIWVLHELEALPAGPQAALALCLAQRARQAPSQRARVIAISHTSLAAAVAEGRVREDLWTQLRAGALALPSFEASRRDLAAWLRAASAREEAERREAAGVPVARWDAAALARLQDQICGAEGGFPSGFGELRALLARLGALADAAGHALVGEADLERGVSAFAADAAPNAAPDVAPDADATGGGETEHARAPVADAAAGRLLHLLGEERVAALDRFERVQLEDVLGVCANARSLSEAGRLLFAASRSHKRSANDADRLRKYLARHGLRFDQLGPEAPPVPNEG